MRIFTSAICIFLFAHSAFVFGQNTASLQASPSSNSSGNLFEQKVFVENKGQFDKKTGVKDDITYQAVTGGVNIYFTKEGLVYRYNQEMPRLDREKEKRKGKEEEERKEIEVKEHSLEMQWLGSNPAVQMVAEDKVDFFYTYSPEKNKEQVKASAYRKIIYKDLYPNIDAEYILPEDKGGIKYSLILHPGANLSDVKMKWKGDDLSVDTEGNITIKTSFGDFIDHAPVTFYADGGSVPSAFVTSGKTVSFSIPSYDNSKTLIIDPWTSSPTFSTNKAYDVNYDFAGNVYAVGSATTFQLVKFNGGGALLWVYNATATSSFGYYGDFAVDGNTGTSYIGAGFNSGGANIEKVNTLGVQTALFPGNPQMLEIWRMDYNYCNGTIICGGGGTSSPSHQAFIMDTNLVNIIPVQVVSTLPDIDVALLSTDKYSNFAFMLFAREFLGSVPALDNMLSKCPLPNLIPTSWGTLTNHTFIEVNSIPYVSSGIGMTNGFNGIAVSPTYVYTYDGGIVKRWNKTTGALINTLNISGTLFNWGGLDVDECDNLYVGVQNTVRVYDVNYNLVTTYNVANTIYDLRISGTKLYTCGNTFVQQIDLTTTPNTVSSTPASCSACNGTATVNVGLCSANTNFTYIWAPGGQTTQTATGLCQGNYTVTVFSNCNIALADTVNVNSTSGFTSTVNGNPASCLSATGSATVTTTGGTPPYTYSWAPTGGANAIATGLSPGNYSVTITDASGCSSVSTVSVTANPSPVSSFTTASGCFNNATTFTDQSTGTPTQWAWDFGDGNTDVVQNPSHTYNTSGTFTVTLIVTNSFGCTDTFVTPVTIYPLPVANFTSQAVCIGSPTCFTDISTISSGSVSGWNWNFGEPASGANNISNLQSPCHTYSAIGTYSVFLTVTSNNGCQSNVSLQATVTGPPTAAFSMPNNCANAPTVFTNSSINATQWTWAFGDGGVSGVQNPTHNYLGSGTYIVTLIASTGGVCSDTAVDTITIYPLPIVIFNADTVCIGNTTSFTDLSTISSGSITTWNWNFGNPASGANNTSALQNPTHVFTQSGSFNVTLTLTSNNGCISSLALQVIVHPLPLADFSTTPGPIVLLTDEIAFTDLSTGSVVQWTWDFGDMTPFSTQQNPAHTYSDTGNYVITLYVVSQYGCRDTIQHPVEIRDFSFYVPNAFTPNNDGINDFFFAKGIGITEYEMWIFDRWGNMIFTCNIPDLPQAQPCMWNAKVRGGLSDEKVQEDVYVWKIHFTNVFKKSYTYVGHVSVVR